MDERIIEQLKNVPCIVTDDENAFELLKSIIYSKIGEDKLLFEIDYSRQELKRINYELDKIKEWGIAKVLLFGWELNRANTERGIFFEFLGSERYSFIHYILYMTNTNPVCYNLPFEMFFNKYRNFLPNYSVCVKRGTKGLFLKYIYEKFGENNVFKAKDCDNTYYVSNKPINPDFIKESKTTIVSLNEEPYEENISILTCRELDKLGYYSFSITEVADIGSKTGKIYSEEMIYQKAKEISISRILKTPTFTEIADIRIILENTEYKLIYQEQLIEILNKTCGYDIDMADYLKKQIVKRKKENLIDLEKKLNDTYGNEGQELFEYLYNYGRYALSKAFVIANLSYLIEH